jgi:segregation and condensation protein B
MGADGMAGDNGPGPAPGGDAQGTVSEPHQQLRLLEALLFAAPGPLDEATLAARMPEQADVPALLEELSRLYANRGVRLVRVGTAWAFRTAPDLAPFMKVETQVTRKLSQAAVETLAVVAYHQPVTRTEIEEIRAKLLSRGTLDLLLEAGWIRPKGRRRTPGRPVTWGTTDAFLDHFGFESLEDLPGIEEIKAAGLLDARPAITAYGGPSATGETDAPPATDPGERHEADRADGETDTPPATDPGERHEADRADPAQEAPAEGHRTPPAKD